MELRLRSSIHQGEGIRDDAIADLIGHDAVAAHEAHEQWQPIVVARNAAARSRSGVAVLEIEEFIADVPVGPGSATASPIDATLPARKRVLVVEGLGALQVLSRALRYSRTE